MTMRVKEFLYTIVEKLQNNIATKYTYEFMSALPGNYWIINFLEKFLLTLIGIRLHFKSQDTNRSQIIQDFGKGHILLSIHFYKLTKQRSENFNMQVEKWYELILKKNNLIIIAHCWLRECQFLNQGSIQQMTKLLIIPLCNLLILKYR